MLHYGDLTDATNLIRIIQDTQPTEIYNLAAQSHVQVSLRRPNTRRMPMRSGRRGFWKPFGFAIYSGPTMLEIGQKMPYMCKADWES